MEELFDKIKRKKKRALAFENFKINEKCDKDPKTSTADRLVTDQNGTTGKNFVYGDYPAQHNACEAIAVHNAKVLLGMPTKLSSTIANFQNLRAMIFRGFFGSNVYKIARVLRKNMIPFRRVFRLRKLDIPGIYILSFWNEKPLKNGLHTVAATYDGATYTTYNLYGNGRRSEELPKEYAKRFIIGYYLGPVRVPDGDRGIALPWNNRPIT